MKEFEEFYIVKGENRTRWRVDEQKANGEIVGVWYENLAEGFDMPEEKKLRVGDTVLVEGIGDHKVVSFEEKGVIVLRPI